MSRARLFAPTPKIAPNLNLFAPLCAAELIPVCAAFCALNTLDLPEPSEKKQKAEGSEDQPVELLEGRSEEHGGVMPEFGQVDMILQENEKLSLKVAAFPFFVVVAATAAVRVCVMRSGAGGAWGVYPCRSC